LSASTAPTPITGKRASALKGKSPKAPTIKEIARLSGVSIGTVDRVIHQRGRVSDETAKRVLAAVEKTGFTPNIFASRLKGGLGASITVLMPFPEQDSGYWGLCLQGIQRAEREFEALKIRLDYRHFDRLSDVSCQRALQETLADIKANKRGIEAIAAAPIREGPFSAALGALPTDFPLAFFDTDLALERPRAFFGQDPFRGGYVAGRLMSLTVEPGAQSAYVAFDGADRHLAERCRGFSAFFAEHGLTVPLAFRQGLDMGAAERRSSLLEFARAHSALAGLFVPNAMASLYAQAAPGLKLVGYDLLPENVAALKDGEIEAIISQRPELAAYESVRALARALVMREALPAMEEMPIDILLRENVDSFFFQKEGTSQEGNKFEKGPRQKAPSP
jgi:LacI family transcriptional regulator